MPITTPRIEADRATIKALLHNECANGAYTIQYRVSQKEGARFIVNLHNARYVDAVLAAMKRLHTTTDTETPVRISFFREHNENEWLTAWAAREYWLCD